MKKRFASLLLTIVCGLFMVGCAPAASPGAEDSRRATYTNPVYTPVFADPCIIRGEDGYFYAYATEDYGNYGGEDRIGYLPIIRSADLVEWSYVADVFSEDTKPAWGKYNSGTWAPDIIKIGDVYNLYYSLSVWDDDNPGIGVCTAPHPAGPWTDRGMVLDTESSGVNNSIDSCTFVYQGAVYMIWGSYRGLYMIALTDDGLAVQSGAEPVRIGGYADSSSVEAAYMIQKDGYYYLFMSLGHCCEGINSSYYVNVVRAKTPFEAWTDRDGKMLLDGKTLGELVVKGNADVAGPGHNCVITDDNGDFWLVYHAYETKYVLGTYGSSPRRSLFIDKLLWDEDGFPYVEGYAPSYSEKEAPFFRTDVS